MTTFRLPLAKGQIAIQRGWSRWLFALTFVAFAMAMWAIWVATASTITLDVDGRSEQVRTHRRSVGAVLLDYGLQTSEVDIVTPAIGSPVKDSMTVRLSMPARYVVTVDGRIMDVVSWGETIGDVMNDADLAIHPYDRLIVNDIEFSMGDGVPTPVTREAAQTFRQAAWDRVQADPLRIQVIRSIPITVDDGTLPFEINTTAQTVGEALREAEIPVYLGDVVQPSLGSEALASMRVSIQRSQPVSFDVDGRIIRTRTRGQTVADALAESEIGLSSLDEVTPPLDSELRTAEHITVVRVQEDIEIDEEIAPFTTVYVADRSLPIDTQQLISPGAEGITRMRTRVRYEDGEEVDRALEDTWEAQEPADRSIAYGQRIEPKTFTADDGSQYTYWRTVRMLASSYSAGTAGVSPDKSYYGRTYTGDPMRHGIVAVDPSIIPLRSQVYVPGYGVGDALDLGGAIRARRIDLGFDDSNLELWNKWVEVYLLWPPPAEHQITWVVPNWPRSPE